MLTKSHLRRALVPAAVTGVLSASALGVAAPAASALDLAPPRLATIAPTAALTAPGVEMALGTTDQGSDDQGAPSQAAPEPTATPQRIAPRVKLRTKPEPWVLPVQGYHLTGRFGASGGLWSSTHTGLDFAADEGSEIHSIGPGVVTEASYDGAYGNKTAVRLDDGTVLWYCHQSDFGVEPGQRVEQGDLIGYVGSTGNVTGPHLHLEVHPGGGEPVDPEAWLVEHHLQP
jgi:murein DD-endopeptidase MepM/ murein hydrolase activator NlpD